MVLWSLRCLAPAAACLFVAVAALRPGSNFATGTSYRDFMPEMGSNPIACLAVHYHQEQNTVSRLTFEWTNRSGSTSSIGSFPSGKVN